MQARVSNWLVDMFCYRHLWTYPSTLPIPHCLYYFQKCWIFFFFFQVTKLCKRNYWIFVNILFVEMNISKLIKLFDGHLLKWPRYYDMVNNQVHHQAYHDLLSNTNKLWQIVSFDNKGRNRFSFFTYLQQIRYTRW